MTSTRRFVRLASALLASSAIGVPATAWAQTADTGGGEPLVTDAINVGDWALRPSLQLRTRVEGRRNPFDTGGYMPPGAELTSRTPPVWSQKVDNQWFVHERARVGMAVERGMFRGVFQLQDARIWGQISPATADQRDFVPSTAAHLAYAELRDTGSNPSFLRLGRQEVQWGEGRLIGRSDWSPTGRSLDAARGVLVVGNFDFEGFSSILSPPGALPPSVARTQGSDGTSAEVSRNEGPGAQLHGLRVAWHVAPLLQLELNALARFVRQPAPAYLTPSDLYLAGLRVSGKYLAFEYSVEGAYEMGRVATSRTDASSSTGSVDDIRAYAGAARAEIATGLFWKMKIGAQGAYASGQKPGDSKVTRFDPILPDINTVHGPMGLYAWSNIIEGAGFFKLTPFRESRLMLGYRYLALARPDDRWQTSELTYIGNDLKNGSRTLGHELDFAFGYTPWAPLTVGVGYGAMLLGDGGKNVLKAMSRDDDTKVQHWGYLQATMTVP